MGELDGPAKDYLAKLAVELSARGIACELVTTGWVPRLRLIIPGYWVSGRFVDAAFEDHIVAAGFGDGQWRFWWPWIEPIASVDDLDGAVKHIVGNTLELCTEDAGVETLAEPKMPAPPDCGWQHGECESCGLLRRLAGRLQARGLRVRTLSYGSSNPVAGSEWVEDIEVTNPATPASGTMRVGHDGAVIWEYRRKLGSDHDARAIMFTITAMLGCPQIVTDLSGTGTNNATGGPEVPPQLVIVKDPATTTAETDRPGNA